MSTLEEMARYPNMMQRKGIYYFRRVIPKELRATYGKREELISLRTRDPAEARRAYHRVALDVERRIEEHRAYLRWQQSEQLQDLEPDQLALVKAAYLAHILEEDEETRLEGFAEDVDPDGDVPFVPRVSWDERIETLDMLEGERKRDYARGLFGPQGFWLDEAREVLSWSNVCLNLAPESPALRKVARVLQEAKHEADIAIRKRNAGEVVPTPPAPSDSVTATDAPSALPVLSTAVDEWLSENEPVWQNAKTARDHRHWIKMFLEINGDKPLDSYSKADGRRFKNTVSRLPANASKKPQLAGLTLEKAAEKAEQLGLPPMSTANLNKGIRRIDSFWHWAGAHYFDHDAPEPMKGLRRRENAAARDRRNPFSVNDLQRVFRSPIYTGFRSERSWRKPGQIIPFTSYRYWLPLMALFSGARLGELCQLEPGDFREEDGVAFFRIGGEGKQLKTAAARRDIPLHPELVRLGLPAFVERRRKQGTKLLFEDFADKTHDCQSAFKTDPS